METDAGHAWLNKDMSAEITNESFHEHSHEIVKDIVAGKCSITNLIERLAGALTDKDFNCRANGTLLLSKVLHGLPVNYLGQEELQVIVNFYIDRLKDHHNVIPAVITGLLAISNMISLKDEGAARIVTALFREVPCQQQLREDRHNIYILIRNFLHNKLTGLASLGPDFVYGVISAIDGERDPRNLLLLFTILPHFLKSVSLGHLVEEMFEVMSCYFPVDFNASAKDPSAVTRDDLASKLCPCLCAVPAFDIFCLPLALEKLDTSLRLAKLDSLKLLTESTKVFPVASYEPHLVQIWSLLQKEYSNKMDNELIIYASETLSALLSMLSKESEKKELFEGFLQRILVSMEAVLVDATAKPVFDIPAAVYITCANATRESCIFISESVYGSLLRFYNLSNDETLKVSALRCASQLFVASANWNTLPNLKYNFDHLSLTCLSACQVPEENLRLAGFFTMAVIAEVIPKEQLQEFYTVMVRSVDFETSAPVILAVGKSILSLSKFHPQGVFSLLKDSNKEENFKSNELKEKRLLALCTLILNNELCFDVMEYIVQSLTCSENAFLTLKALKKIFEDKLMKIEVIVEIENRYKLVPLLLKWLFENPHTVADDSLIRASFINLIVRNLPASAQSELLMNHALCCLEKLGCNSSMALMPLHALLIPLRTEVYIKNLNRIVQSLYTIALDNGIMVKSSEVQHKSHILIANILNKAYVREKNSEDFQAIYHTIESAVNDLTCSTSTVTLFIWFSKGLVLCGHPSFEKLINKLAALLDNERVGMTAANGFKIIMEDTEDLNSACHCTVNFLYKQRVFEAFVNYSLARENDNRGNVQTNEAYLLGWAYMCQNIARSLLKRVPQLTSIIVESLKGKNVDLLLTTLSTALYLAQNKDLQFVDSLQTILPRLIELSHHKESMKVRIKSLELLYAIAEQYDNVLLLPYKQDMIYEWLVTQLDDRKRLVRNAAVKARTRWFLLGSPGEEK